jgi:chromosome segregation ATPase
MAGTRKGTVKDTVSEVVAESTKAVKTKKEVGFDPVEVAQTKHKDEITEKTESFISKLEPAKLVNNLTDFVTALQKVIEEYQAVKESVRLAKEELQELFNIKIEAETLVALITAQNESAQAKDIEMEQKIKSWEIKIDDVRLRFDDEYRRLSSDMKKKTEEFEYEFSRRKQKMNNDLDDEITQKTATFNKTVTDQTEAFNKREAELIAKQERLIDIEQELSDREGIIENAIERAVADNTTKLVNNSKYEVNYIKKDFEGKLALLENQLETAKGAICDLKVENQNLKSDLNQAYSKIEAIAAKSIEGASNANAMATFKDMLKTKQTESTK